MFSLFDRTVSGKVFATLKSMLRVVFLITGIAATAVPATAIETKPQKRDFWGIREIRIGYLAHDVDGLWSNSRKESGSDFNGEILFASPSWCKFYGTIRPNLGLSVNDTGQTSKVYGGMIWELEMQCNAFVSLGLGLALHNGELDTREQNRKALGSRILFRVPIEFGYSWNRRHRVSFLFDHISNGYLRDPNEGLDTLGVRYGYRF